MQIKRGIALNISHRSLPKRCINDEKIKWHDAPAYGDFVFATNEAWFEPGWQRMVGEILNQRPVWILGAFSPAKMGGASRPRLREAIEICANSGYMGGWRDIYLDIPPRTEIGRKILLVANRDCAYAGAAVLHDRVDAFPPPAMKKGASRLSLYLQWAMDRIMLVHGEIMDRKHDTPTETTAAG